MGNGKIYTRTGDDGTTALNGGKRVSKTDVRVEAYGTVDELNAFLGELVTWLTEDSDREYVMRVQCDLFSLGAYLATDPATAAAREGNPVFSEEDIRRMERKIDALQEGLPAWKGFVLPGGSRGAAVCHVCRTVCRRAERRILALAREAEVCPLACAYVNRLSDFLFVLSRKILFLEGKDEFIWKKC